MDALKSFFDMKRSGLAGIVDSVEVKDAIGGIGWRLNFSY